MTTPCEPWCQPPPKTFPGVWVCPECGSRWYVEEHVERLIAWCRQHISPRMTESQLDFLRAYLCGQAFQRHPHLHINGIPNRGLEQR